MARTLRKLTFGPHTYDVPAWLDRRLGGPGLTDSELRELLSTGTPLRDIRRVYSLSGVEWRRLLDMLPPSSSKYGQK